MSSSTNVQKRRRRVFAADDRVLIRRATDEDRVKVIGTTDLNESGKLHPAKFTGGSLVSPDEERETPKLRIVRRSETKKSLVLADLTAGNFDNMEDLEDKGLRRLHDEAHEFALQKRATKRVNHVDFQGLPVSVEREKGTIRTWRSRNGESGETKMLADYGYIRGTKGVDGDHVDVYLGSKKDASQAFVVHQRKKLEDGKFGDFDEDKVMLGFSSVDEAKKMYVSHMGGDEGFVMGVDTLSMEDFKKKLEEHGGSEMLKALSLDKVSKIFDEVIAPEMKRRKLRFLPLEGGALTVETVKRQTAAALLMEAGPPDEWSGGVAGILGKEGRKRVTSLWNALSKEDKESARSAFSQRFESDDVMFELEEKYAKVAKKKKAPTPQLLSEIEGLVDGARRKLEMEGGDLEGFELDKVEVDEDSDGDGGSITISIRRQKGIGHGAVDVLKRHVTGDVEAQAWIDAQASLAHGHGEGQLTLEEGDRGEGVFQTHEKGLSEAQARASSSMGWHPLELLEAERAQLKNLVGESWNEWSLALAKAKAGDASDLRKLFKFAAPAAGVASFESMGIDERSLVEKIRPVDVHTDLRLQPTGADYCESFEVVTSSSQHDPNRIMQIARGEVAPAVKAIANMMVGEDQGELKSHSGWMTAGDGEPFVAEPGQPGTDTDSFSRFEVRERFKWQAGLQEPRFKEFFFTESGSGDIDGRWVLQSVEAGRGQVWLLSKPPEQKMKSRFFETRDVEKKIVVPILKRNNEQRLVTGVVLQPGVVDAQGDIITAEVIQDAAHKFISKFNAGTQLGFMHNDFTRNFELVESFIVPVEMTINGRKVLKGSWVMTVKVLDAAVWKAVKEGRLKGFSIGGMARVRRLES